MSVFMAFTKKFRIVDKTHFNFIYSADVKFDRSVVKLQSNIRLAQTKA